MNIGAASKVPMNYPILLATTKSPASLADCWDFRRRFCSTRTEKDQADDGAIAYEEYAKVIERIFRRMLDERDFQKSAKRRSTIEAPHAGTPATRTLDVEAKAAKLEVYLKKPEEAKFVISPNTPMREIWISALSTSFKLDGRRRRTHSCSRKQART